MDTRKLEIIMDTGIYIDKQPGQQHGAPLVDSRNFATSLYDRADIAAELVKRWNAYPQLVEALKEAEGGSNGSPAAGPSE